MDLVQLIVILVVIGVMLWLIENYLPISQPIKLIIRVVIILVVCLWLLRIFFGPIAVPTVR